MKRSSKILFATIMTLSLGFAACGNKEEITSCLDGNQNTESAITSTDLSNDESGLTSEALSNDITGGKYAENGELIIGDVNWESKVFAPENDNNLVFYEIFTGSFSDSDGDGNGDLQGIINRLDYLNDGDEKSGLSLGIDGIWLTPVMSSPSYHRYDVADYYAIDSELGTMEDLKAVATECHKRGVKLIIDLVINHTSSQNQWFKNFCQAHKDNDTSSEYYDMYTWAEEPITGRTFRKISGSDHYYECNFSGDMPELNYDNDKVREEMVNVAKYYLEEIGVDGFRFDAAKYIYYGDQAKNVEFWTWYMDELKSIKPDIYTVAEVWDSDSLTQKYEVALNCFDFTMSQADGMIAQTAKKGDVNGYVSYVSSYLQTIQELNDTATIMPFIANHDMDRAAGFLQASNGFAQMGANLYILGPGSPFIYYGEEIGLKGSRGSANTDANRRLAMTWGDGDKVKDPEGTNYEDKYRTNASAIDQLSDEYSLYNYYKRLIMIRKANPEIASGEYTPLKFLDTKVGGFVSTLDGSSVCVIHNTTSSSATIDLSSATDLSFDKINAIIGYGEIAASLDGTKLTISAQTSVVLR